MTFVFVGLGMLSFLAATMLAIDVGMLMTARGQAQNSADAGALSGAVAMVYDDFNDRTAGGPIVQSALRVARSNVTGLIRNGGGGGAVPGGAFLRAIRLVE